MPYLSDSKLKELNFKHLGNNVKISDKASIYDAEKISIGDNSRVDDFCILSGNITIGDYVHITPMCLVAGGEPGITLDNFCTLAYGVKVFSQSDDYSGESMVNSLIDKKFKKEHLAPVKLEKHVIVGTNTVIFPGVTVAEGCAIGAMTLVNRTTQPWSVYIGAPAKFVKPRSKNLLKLTADFIKAI